MGRYRSDVFEKMVDHIEGLGDHITDTDHERDQIREEASHELDEEMEK